MKKHKSVILFSEWKKPLEALNLEQKGRILDALLDFPDGIQPDFEDPLLLMAWAFMEGPLRTNAEKWDDIREKRAAAGRKGAEATNAKHQQNAANPANADFVQQNAANPAVTVTGNVTVTDNVTVTAKEKAAAAGTQTDAELAQIVQHYQKTIGEFPRSALDKLQNWRETFSTEMILLAIDKAAEAGKRSWNYINGILKGWKQDGLHTLGEVAAADDRRAKQKANAPRNKAFMASRPPEEAAKAEDAFKTITLENSLNRLKKKKPEVTI